MQNTLGRARHFLVVGVVALASMAVAAHAAFASSYYVDCSAGTNGSGTQVSPFNSLSSVNGHSAFVAGDAIYFKRATTCTGMLAAPGSGNSSSPITIDAYGTGAQPVIDGAGQQQAISVVDQEYWDINNLEAKDGNRFAVRIMNDVSNTTLHHIHLTNITAHDSGPASIATWGGLIMAYGCGTNTYINDVVVDGALAYNSTYGRGIELGRLPGCWLQSFGSALNDSLKIENSTVHDVGLDGALVEVTSNGLEDNNVVYNTGSANASSIGYTPNGTWTWFCSGCTTQFNETYNTHSWGVDGGAYDIDTQNTNNVLQYNYGHDADGYCFAVFGADSTTTENPVVRYNVCSNNVRDSTKASQGDAELTTWNSGTLDGLRIYNNTFYGNPASSSAPIVANSASFSGANPNFVKNNIFYDANNKFIDSNSSLYFNNNLWYTTSGSSPTWVYGGSSYTSLSSLTWNTNQELTGQYADPLLNSPTYHSTGTPTTEFTLQSTSPAIDTGIDPCLDISGCSAGSRDFFGNSLLSGAAYDIGADESSYTKGAGALLLFDDFENLGMSAWSTSGGTWSNCQPVGHSHQLCLSGTDSTMRYTALAGSTGWTNYSVKAYVAPTTTSSFSAGVVGRASDTSNYYMLTITTDSGTTTWAIFKVVSNTATSLTSGSYTGGWPAYLKLDLNGTTLSASYSTDDSSYTSLGSVTDSTFSSGKAGVRTYGTDAHFDAVKVVKD